MHWRRKWQPTPVFLPGVSQGRGRLVGCHLWGRTELETTAIDYIYVSRFLDPLFLLPISLFFHQYHTALITVCVLALLRVLPSRFSRVRLCATP